MKLNKDILNIIMAVQHYKKHRIAENMLLNKKGHDWYGETEKYYYGLPDEIIHTNGLKKNIDTFEKIISYPVTEKIRSTLYSGLWQFDF